ncbi:MAG: hypothetical protein KAG84_04550 [Bacteroidales bacterium]|nr:hypothetical protein [Bacteroidales bacterium]
MKTLNILLIILGIIVSINAFAQDRIIKTNLDTIYCDIKEINTTEIKYKLPNYPADLIFGIDIEKVNKVIFRNGMEKTFTLEMNNPENYTSNNKNAIKFHFLSPMVGNIAVSYEKSISPGRSMEFGAGYIYGFSDDEDNGVILRAGFKFMRTPDFYFSRMKYSHILKGSYVKPEIIFNSFNTKNYNYQTNKYTKENVTSFSLLIVLGKQIIFSNAFLIDYYAGFGYGYTTNDNVSYYYSNTIVETDIPFSFTAGLKIGFLIK